MDGSAIEDPSASGLATPDPRPRSMPSPTYGGRACWRDHLAVAEPAVVIW